MTIVTELNPQLGRIGADRIAGIDAMRLIAIFGVAFIHADHHTVISTAASLAARFSVPFFFISSGYFISRRTCSSYKMGIKSFRRIMIPFAAWSILYVLKSRDLSTWFATKQGLAELLLGHGPGYHLWFLPSLALCTVVILAISKRSLTFLLLLALICYSIGLIAGPYLGPLTGYDQHVWNTRDGLMFGLPFMTIGFILATRQLNPPLWIGWIMFLGGGFLQAAEYYALTSDHWFVYMDQLIGTVPFGLGAFILSLHIPELRIRQWAASLGRYSMGLFTVHLAVLEFVEKLIPIRSFPSELVDIAAALLITTLTCILACRVPIARPFFR